MGTHRFDISKRMKALTYRRFFKSLLLYLFISLIAAPSSAGQEDTPVDTGILEGGIAANPQTTYTFLGWDQLGKGLGLKDEWGSVSADS